MRIDAENETGLKTRFSIYYAIPILIFNVSIKFLIFSELAPVKSVAKFFNS